MVMDNMSRTPTKGLANNPATTETIMPLDNFRLVGQKTYRIPS